MLFAKSAPTSHLPELEVLHQKITSKLSDMISGYNSNEEIVYECTNGQQAIGKAIVKRKELAIQECRLPAGCDMPAHEHDVFEIIAVLSGRCEARILMPHGQVNKKLTPLEMVYFEPGQRHEFIALTDAVVIGITIPADEGYPDERQRPFPDASALS